MGMDHSFAYITGTDNNPTATTFTSEPYRSAKTRPMNEAMYDMHLPRPPKHILKALGRATHNDEHAYGHPYDDSILHIISADQWPELMRRTHQHCQWPNPEQDGGFTSIANTLTNDPSIRWVIIDTSV